MTLAGRWCRRPASWEARKTLEIVAVRKSAVRARTPSTTPKKRPKPLLRSGKSGPLHPWRNRPPGRSSDAGRSSTWSRRSLRAGTSRKGGRGVQLGWLGRGPSWRLRSHRECLLAPFVRYVYIPRPSLENTHVQLKRRSKRASRCGSRPKPTFSRASAARRRGRDFLLVCRP